MSEQYDLLININANIEKALTAMQQTAEATTKMATASEQASQKVDTLKQKMDSNTVSASTLVKGFSGVATSAWALYQGYDRLVDTQVSVDRAMVAAKSSANALEDAQTRYNATVQKYGPASAEATAALKDLQLAQERATVAQERADMVQGNLKESYVGFALGVLPAGITMVDSLGKTFGQLTTFLGQSKGATDIAAQGLTSMAGSAGVAATSAGGLGAALGGIAAFIVPLLPIIAVVAAIAGVLYLAYQNCEPFRNAVNALADALGQWFSRAVEGAGAVLGWLMDNVIIPFANVIGSVLVPIINVLVGAINTLGGVWDWLTGRTVQAQQDQTAAIEAETQNQINAINEKYTALEKAENDSYAKQIDDTAKAWSDKLKATTTGFDAVVDEYNRHYDDLEADVRTALDNQLSDIEKGYQDQTDTIQQKYDDQVAATETLYDELIGVIDKGLAAIKAARDGELDDLELNMLLQKKALEEAYAAGEIDKETYEKNLKTIEDTYREQRSEASDKFRLEELQYEKDHAGEIEKLEQEKADALKTIAEQRDAALKVLADEQATAEEKAKAEATLKILALEEQRKNDVEAIRTDEKNLAIAHEEALKTLAEQKTAEINAVVTKAEDDKKAIYATKNAEIAANMQTWWTNVSASTSEWASNVTKIITDSWEALKNVSASIWAGIQTVLQGAWNLISTASSTVWNAMSNAVVTIWNTFKTNAPGIWSGIQGVLNTAWTTIQTVSSTLWTAMITNITTLWDSFKGGAPGIWSGIQTILNTSWTAIRDVGKTIWDAIPKNITDGWTTFKNGIDGTWSGIQTALSSAWGSISSTASSIWGSITGSINGAISALQDYLGIDQTPQVPTPTPVNDTVTNITPTPPPTPSYIYPGGSGGMAGFQRGFEGIISQPTMALIGEAGPERVSVQPITGGVANPSNLTSLSINLNFSGPLSFRDLSQMNQFVDVIYDRISKRVRSEIKTSSNYVRS